MQELIVFLIVILSCGILYKYSLPYAWKYRIRLFFSGLGVFFHAYKLARKIHPGNKVKQAGNICNGCSHCHQPTKTTIHPVRILRKNDMGK